MNLSNSFVTDQQRGVFDYNEPYILVTDQNVDQVEDLLPILEQVAREGKPLVVIAENVEGQALAALIMNTVRGTMKVAAIKAPHYGEERRNTLSDLAIATGATIASRTTGLHLKDMKLEHLGNAKRVEASKVVTTIVNGKGNLQAVQERIDLLSAELEVIEDMQVAELTQSRITRLSSGVAIIKVGGTTEVEMIERKHRIEDSLAAVNSAREEINSQHESSYVHHNGMCCLNVQKKTMFFLQAFMVWIVLCLPGNIVTLVLYQKANNMKIDDQVSF